MKTTKEYEIIGVTTDGNEEYCAGTNDIEQAYHYMVMYFQDYDTIELYEVSKCKIKTLKQESINFEENYNV